MPSEAPEHYVEAFWKGLVELQDVTPPDTVKPVLPQYGIELVDVRIKLLDYVESVREKV